MRTASLATAVAGLVLGLLVSATAWLLFDTLLLFLFLPFVPVFLRGREQSGAERGPAVRRCPRCGFETVDAEFEYCPRDGTRLKSAGPAD